MLLSHHFSSGTSKKNPQLIQPTTVADKSRIDAPKAKCSLTSSPFKVAVSFGAVAKGRRLEQVDSSKQDYQLCTGKALVKLDEKVGMVDNENG